MLSRIKKFMPTGILAVGILIFCTLFSIRASLLHPPSDYNTFVLAEQIREAALAVITECTVAAGLFKISLRKGKSSDRDSGQKL